MKTGTRPVLLALLFLFGGVQPARLLTQEAPPDTIIMRGPTVAGVRFVHVDHVERAECVACHHESRPELPSSDEYGRCSSCHTETVEPPLVTNRRDAFHDRRARQGLCVDCHITEAAAGKATPARCADCHKDDLN
jgi:hypothetical protein